MKTATDFSMKSSEFIGFECQTTYQLLHYPFFEAGSLAERMTEQENLCAYCI